MANITVKKVNESVLKIGSDDHGILMEACEHFTFMVDGYKFIPSYRNKLWDGKCRLLDLRNHTLPYGLLLELIKFANSRKYTVEIDVDISQRVPTDKQHLIDYSKTLNLTDSKCNNIEARDYQVSAFAHALSEGRSLVISPTGSGKSLIIYMMVRWFLDHHDEKVLIVVPTTSLVEQLSKDFDDYSKQDDGFDAAVDVHKIYSGKEKNAFSGRVVVTTWQSAITLPKSWFLQYGMVVGDEAHLFKAKSLNSIMANVVNAQYRIGTTGTIDGSVCNELVLVGNFGPVHRVITTKQLMDNDTLASLKIKCLVLNHDDELKKLVSKMDYQHEIDAIVSHPGRNSFISKLACDQKGNTLVLFNLVSKHGKPLYKQILSLIDAAADQDRKAFYVSGEVNATDRENIRGIVENEKNAIIVASSATFSTGINIKNLHTIIFAAPTKSQIRVLQSIGRGLRKSDNGVGTVVYDISDNFSWKKKKNYTMTHAIERIKIYEKESFEYKVYEIPMPL
jgi:superfamily II DNA or RNA helicase